MVQQTPPPPVMLEQPFESLPLSPHSPVFTPALLGPPPSSLSPAWCRVPPPPSLLIYQLNCHVSKAVTLSIMNEGMLADVLVLQEPWINPYDLSPPAHPAWSPFSSFEHSPSTWLDRHKAVIYVKKSILSYSVCPLPGGSQCLAAVELVLAGVALRLVNVYSPPPSFSSVPLIAAWLQNHASHSIPTFVCLDSNLHHPHWNPIDCKKKEPKAAVLLLTFSAKGFRMASPRHSPTFFLRTGSRFTLDHIWANYLGSKLIASCDILDGNCGSDHQLLKLTLNVSLPPPPSFCWSTPVWKDISQERVGCVLEFGKIC